MAPATMLEQALDFPRQLRAGLAAAEQAGMADRRPSAVALCGLGGSAAGGRLLCALFAEQVTVPVVPVDTTSLPGWVGEDTLVVCISYSGQTAETRWLWDEAGDRGSLRAAVTAGGALAEAAQAIGAPCALVEPGFQPRGALGLLLGALVGILDRAGVAPGAATALAAAIPAVERAVAVQRADDAPARAHAEQLAGKAVVLYGSGARAAAAVRLKNQINENAKAAAWAGSMPEMAHNEVLGWIGCARHGIPAAAVFLRDAAEPPAPADLHDRIQGLVAGDVATVLEWRGSGDDELERTLALLVHGDVVSCHLAEAEGVDALDIARLTALKAPPATG
ncbi:MAG: SIS domain-containing protein [Gaiellales bacterium]